MTFAPQNYEYDLTKLRFLGKKNTTDKFDGQIEFVRYLKYTKKIVFSNKKCNFAQDIEVKQRKEHEYEENSMSHQPAHCHELLYESYLV